MNWMKVAAVVVGGVVVYFVVHAVIGIVFTLFAAIAFVAIVAGGVYAATKISQARKHRQVQRSEKRAEREVRRQPRPESRPEPGTEVRPAAPRPAPARPHDVEDDLARLKREMGA